MIKIDSLASAKIVISMANLLRYSINYEIDSIKLEDDIKYIEDYLVIQKYRFNKKFDYAIEVDENAKKLTVPKLIIQPLIENSLKYGFEKKGYLKVSLKCYVENGKLILKVIDTGYGIELAKLSEINEILKSNENKTNHVGLFNVHRRINLLYGQTYGISIKSEEGTGTEIIVSLPEIIGTPNR
jgi:sensor histidine kinase YesM